MIGVDPLLVETTAEILRDQCTGDVVRSAETAWPAALALTWVQAELHRVGVTEDAGGVGGSAAEAAAVVRTAGQYACPLPVAEQALLGGWLAATAGLELPDGLVTCAVDGELHMTGERVSGTVRRAPWAQEIDTVIALADNGTSVVLLRATDGVVTPGRNLAGERRDTLTVNDAPCRAAAVSADLRDTLRARAAATRVLLLAGACTAVQQLTVRHAASRKQFGKPIHAFQAVASHLARIAEETALVTAAADLVTLALDGHGLVDEAAVAKTVAGGSASTVARLAHQVHGAIGVTEEYDLQLFTRRIWSWRDEARAEPLWARAVGGRLVSAGPSGAWDVVAGPVGVGT